MSNKPTVRKLDIALKELIKWKRFALHLPGIEDYNIQTIESEDRGDIEGQKMALYGKWLGANPDASWDDVANALETVEEITIAKKIREDYSIVKKTTLFSSPMSPATNQSLSTPHLPKEVTVPEDVPTELERLETSFNDLRREVTSEVKANIKNDTMQIDTLKQEISNQKAFSIPSLEAVTTADSLFTTICPYYNFLSCHLIIVIATKLLSEKIAIKAEEYKETLQSFKHSTKVRYLKEELQRYNRFRSSISAKVRIVVEDCWGEQSLGLVEILVKTLFPVKNSDELPWYEVTSGSLAITFMAFDHMTSSLVEYSMEKTSFMSLVGVVSLSIGDKLSSLFFSFDDCLIQAALANKVEVVAFLLKHTTVNVNAASESHFLINVSEELFYTKSEAEHALEEDYNAFSKLLEDIEYYSPPVQSESIFRIIFLKNFLNERILSEQSLLEQLPQHLLHKVDSYKHATASSKKQIDVKFLANVINKYVPHKLPNYEKIILTLHSVWGDCSIQYIEQLGELILTPSFFQETQLTNVQTNDTLILTFLAPVHILQNIKAQAQFMFKWNFHDVFLPFLGVVSIKVANSTVYTKHIKEDFSWYSFSYALSLAEETLAQSVHKAEPKVKKVIELLKQINKMPKEFKDIFSADENGNYGCLLHPGATALIIACCNDNIDLVRLLLEHNADPNTHGRSTLTPLMYSSGNMQIFKMLIDHGADIDALAFYNETVLHCACVVGNMQIVKYVLVQRENMIHKTNREGVTPFYYACEYGHIAIINQLIRAKADPNAQNSVTGWTGLMEASYYGYEAIVKRLVSLKVIDLNLQNTNEETALMLASTEGHAGIVELLLEHHCDPSLRNKAGNTAFSLSCTFGHKKILEALLIDDDLLNAQNFQGKTALANACCGAHSEVVEWLLEKSVDPNISDSQGETPLKLAACYGHINIVEQLLQIDSLNVNVLSANGDTALMAASRQGHSDIVEMLLRKGADPSIQSTDGWTAVMIASFEGDIAIVKQLIKVMPNKDLEIKNNWGGTATFIACMHGHLEVVKLFIQEATVELDLQDNNGWTPLMSASKRGNAIVDLLLQQNANPNQRENNAGATVLMIATIHGHVQTVEQLLKHNADPGLQDKNGWTALMYASDKGHIEIVRQLLQSIEGKASIDFQNNDGSTALILANASGHVTIVKCLLKEKADPNIQDKQGMTALIKAVCKDQQQAVKWLLESKADPNIQDNEGQTALWMASKMGSITVSEHLLSKNSDPNIQNGKGSTPLMMAIGNRHPEVVRQLLDSKADPNTQDNTGETPLILAVKLNCPDTPKIVEWLLREEADPNVQHTTSGATALIIASGLGYISVARQLLQYKADPNIQDKVVGETALIAASKCGYLELVDCLLQAKADPNIRNKFEGQTALVMSSAWHCIPIVKKLLQYKADPNIQDNFGETSLMKACCVRSAHQIEVVECLLEAKADPNITNSKGETALILASARYACNPDIIRTLLQENIALNIQENTKRHTALMAACDIPTVVEDNVEVVKCLLEKKAEVNLQDIQGQTALMMATQHCNTEIIKCLIGSQADPNIPNKEGRTPLLDAVIFDRIDIVRSLLKNNADPNIKDNKGRSAMGIAQKYNLKRHLELFQSIT